MNFTLYPDGLTECERLRMTDLALIDAYCESYVSVLPHLSILAIGVLTIISILLYKYEHPNYFGFVKMTWFVTLLLGFANGLVFIIAS